MRSEDDVRAMLDKFDFDIDDDRCDDEHCKGIREALLWMCCYTSNDDLESYIPE